MSGTDDHNQHFWVGALFAGTGLILVVLLGDQRLGTGLRGLIALAVLLGFVLMVRYPLRKRRPG